MDISYNGTWGYSALLVSLANTAEPLYQSLNGANRPSHEGVVPLYDRSIELCRRAGFIDILLRGDELYPEVVDGHEEKGGVPSRLIKTDRRVRREVACI